MENQAKSTDSNSPDRYPFIYEESWSITQGMTELSAALRNGRDVAIKTSGSSGTPKEILLPASALIFSARNSNNYLGAKPGDRWSLLLSPTHTAGLNVLVRSMELGTEPVSLEQSAEYSAIVPTQLYRALNEDSNLLDHLRKCKKVLVGGAAIDAELLAKAKVAGINCVTTYGMTETCGGCVYDGVPFPGVGIKVGETIGIKGPMLAKVPTKDGYFITNDLGFIKDGKLHITGRADDVIISGGKNISLSAIESWLSTEFASEFGAIGSPDAEWGSALIVATTAQNPDSEIQSRLSEAFGIKAKSIMRVKAIPRTALSKVDRTALGKLLPQ